MRYVVTDQLRPDMVLAKDLPDASGNLLLKAMSPITLENIHYLEFIGVPGVYIDDEMTEDIAYKETVSPEVKSQALSVVQGFFAASAAEAEEVEVPAEERLVRLVVENVVNDVLANKDVMYNMIDIRNYSDYTYFHCMNTGVLAGIMGAKMGLEDEELQDLVTAAFLHDIGKVFVLPDLVEHPRKLTPEENEKLKDHAKAGYEFISTKYQFSEAVTMGIYQHHEWFNGKGYPMGVRGKDLGRIARILRVADVYDTLTSKQPYRPAYQPAEVMEYLMARNGMEFDPDIVKLFFTQCCIYPIGMEVQLSDGRHAVVVENHQGFMTRPSVRLMDTGETIDLRGDRAAYCITIQKVFI